MKSFPNDFISNGISKSSFKQFFPSCLHRFSNCLTTLQWTLTNSLQPKPRSCQADCKRNTQGFFLVVVSQTVIILSQLNLLMDTQEQKQHVILIMLIIDSITLERQFESLQTEERVSVLSNMFWHSWQKLGFGSRPHHWQRSARRCRMISAFNRRCINRNWHRNDNDRLPVTSLLPCYSSCLQTNTEQGTNGLLMGFADLLLIKPLATRAVCLYKTSAPV